MKSPTSYFPLLIMYSSLLACDDPIHETGRPDERPAPRSDIEAATQHAAKIERQTALQTAGLCTPAAKRTAREPDERFWHCRGEDWDGSLIIKEQLARLSDPFVYQRFCETPTFDPLGIRFTLCEGVEHQGAHP